jgi:hypothetical protein
MRDEERRRLIELERKAIGTPLQEEILEQLYAEPKRFVEVTLELRIDDSLLEYTSIQGGGGDMVATEIMAELSDEWFSRYRGASWWIREYRGWTVGEKHAAIWHKTEDPWPPSETHKGHDIQVLITDKTWHQVMADGTIGDAAMHVSSDETERYCMDCDEIIEL